MIPVKKCLDFIKNKEGLELNAYQDSAGVRTIDYCTLKFEENIPEKMGGIITR